MTIKKLAGRRSLESDRGENHDELIKQVREVILKCICTEKVVIKDNQETLVMSRLVKIVNGEIYAKCKKCGQWVLVPLELL